MKKILLSALLLITSFSTNVKSQSYPAEMEHFWRLEEENPPYIDSYAGINGTSTNQPQRVNGLIGYSQSFKDQEIINLPAAAEFNWEANSSFTIEYWIKTSYISITGNGNVVVIGRDDNSSSLHWWVGYNKDGKAAFNLTDNSGNGVQIINVGQIITDGQWHHIAAVRDFSTLENKLYVDGDLITDTVISYSSDFISNKEINIGWINLHPYYFYNGEVDEIAVYSRSLDDLEIERNYYNGLMGKGYDATLAELILENGRTESGKFKFDVSLVRTGVWTAGPAENILGNSGFYFQRNTSALSDDPEVILGPYFSNGSYSASTSMSGEDIIVDLSFSSPAGGAQQAAINNKYLLFTVEISILDFKGTAGIEWAESNIIVRDGNNYPLPPVLTGDLTNIILPVETEQHFTEYNLYQNSPNPFNPSTSIKYTIPEGKFITLKVYDFLGREIATLADEFKTAGSYEVEFNGSGLSSGTYFYSLRVDDPSAGSGRGFIVTKKFLLLK